MNIHFSSGRLVKNKCGHIYRIRKEVLWSDESFLPRGQFSCFCDIETSFPALIRIFSHLALMPKSLLSDVSWFTNMWCGSNSSLTLNRTIFSSLYSVFSSWIRIFFWTKVLTKVCLIYSQLKFYRRAENF